MRFHERADPQLLARSVVALSQASNSRRTTYLWPPRRSRSWVYFYRWQGKQKRRTLGPLSPAAQKLIAGPTVDLDVYAFLTTTPNKLVATINHERMPVLLTREEEFETWLSGSPDEAFALARQYPPERMCIVQEGFEKKDLLRAAA